MWKRNGGRISRGLRALERAGYVKLRRDYDGTFCEWTEAGVRAGWASRATLTQFVEKLAEWTVARSAAEGQG